MVLLLLFNSTLLIVEIVYCYLFQFNKTIAILSKLNNSEVD